MLTLVIPADDWYRVPRRRCQEPCVLTLRVVVRVDCECRLGRLVDAEDVKIEAHLTNLVIDLADLD